MKKIKPIIQLIVIMVMLNGGIDAPNVYAVATNSEQEQIETTKTFHMNQWIVLGVIFISSMTMMTVITHKKNQQKSNKKY